jgi:hypothetical protein
MESPAFWRDLQEQFRALPDPKRDLYGSDHPDGTWTILGGPSDHTLQRSVETQFRALAVRAALAAELNGNSPLDAWLNRLKQGPHFTPAPISSDPPENGVCVVEGGWIDHLCVASAECCVELETEAYERERAQPRTLRSSDRVGGPRLAEWLRAQMIRHDMTVNRLHALSDLDRKTIEKMLAAQRVRVSAFEKLARGLSADSASVAVSDIPTD